MLYFPQHGWRIYYRKRISEPTASVSSRSTLQKILAESRSPVNFPDMVLCPGTETLLLFASVILFLSHRSKQNRKECQLHFYKDNIPPLSLTECAKDFYVLLCQFPLLKKQDQKNPQKPKNKKPKTKTEKNLELLRIRKEKVEEMEASDVILIPSVLLS